MLTILCLDEKWCSWIKACVPIASFTNMMNGGPSGFFTASRGLRQISPLLLIVAMEALKNFFPKLGRPICSGICVSGREMEESKSFIYSFHMISCYFVNKKIGLAQISDAC